MLHKIENIKSKEQELHSFRIWQGEECLDFDIIGTPIIGDCWLTIRTIKIEFDYNCSDIYRFEFT